MAELLLILTGRSLFDDASRFCVWFGVGGALFAVCLGWLLGGFEIIGQDAMLTAHRWLGTLAAMWAVLVFVLSEWSRRTQVRNARLWFRLSLLIGAILVIVSGFLGGSLIYGLDYYLL